MKIYKLFRPKLKSKSKRHTAPGVFSVLDLFLSTKWDFEPSLFEVLKQQPLSFIGDLLQNWLEHFLDVLIALRFIWWLRFFLFRWFRRLLLDNFLELTLELLHLLFEFFLLVQQVLLLGHPLFLFWGRKTAVTIYGYLRIIKIHLVLV